MSGYYRVRQAPIILLDILQSVVICGAAVVVLTSLQSHRYMLPALLTPVVLLELAFVYGTTVKEVYVDSAGARLITLLGLHRSYKPGEITRLWMDRPGPFWRELWVWGEGPFALMIYGGPFQPFSARDCDQLAEQIKAFNLVCQFDEGPKPEEPPLAS